MEREFLSSSDRAGSYPPQSCASSTTIRNQFGYQKLTWGAYPPNYRPGTAPNRGDLGYNHEREAQFPEGSQMHTEYLSYKKRDAEAGEATTKYRDMKKSYKDHNAKTGSLGDFDGYMRDQHGSLAGLATEAGNAAKC